MNKSDYIHTRARARVCVYVLKIYFKVRHRTDDYLANQTEKDTEKYIMSLSLFLYPFLLGRSFLADPLLEKCPIISVILIGT